MGRPSSMTLIRRSPIIADSRLGRSDRRHQRGRRLSRLPRCLLEGQGSVHRTDVPAEDRLPARWRRVGSRAESRRLPSPAFKTSGTLYPAPATTTISASGYTAVVNCLTDLPEETVIDGEIVAFDEDGTLVQ